ncbi:MAG TPA: dihydrofolate reductase family protein [Gaiellaceae bacterium]|nr:dihydrofolate reductase family protein [Gaiellaceae bacterium]
MRKLVESTFMTLDGVINDPQNWSGPYWDDEHAGYARGLLFSSDALLLGRKTYEGFAQAWPQRAGDNDFADRFNELPKFVASRSMPPGQAEWNATVLEGDVADAVAKLKDEDGETIIKYGTGEFSKALLENKLVDEYHFWIFPEVMGSGDRLLDGFRTSLELVDTTRFKSGIVVLKLAPK